MSVRSALVCDEYPRGTRPFGAVVLDHSFVAGQLCLPSLPMPFPHFLANVWRQCRDTGNVMCCDFC